MGYKERIQHKEKIIHMFLNEGINLTNISKNLKINRLDVKKVLVENGLYKEQKRLDIKYDISTQQHIVDLYTKENLSIKEISKITDRGAKTIKKALQINGIDIKHAGFYNRKYTLNENVFSKYTPESAYWAGFVAGDGCVYSHGISDSSLNNCLNVGLAYVDRKHVLKFKAFLEYDGILYENEKKGKSALNINNTKIVSDLEQYYNITHLKTKTYQPPSSIPQDLLKYFILGLFDSDGCITRSKRPNKHQRHYNGDFVYTITFTGTKETCEFIKKFFNSSVKLSKRHKNKVNNYTVLFQGNLQVIDFLGKLYDDVSIEFCLKRKYKKYNELIQQYS